MESQRALERERERKKKSEREKKEREREAKNKQVCGDRPQPYSVCLTLKSWKDPALLFCPASSAR